MSELQYYCTSWGNGSQGQLGSAPQARESFSSNQAVQVTTLDKRTNFIDVACGENHSLMLTNTFQLLSCGSNTYGQLGTSTGENAGGLQRVADDIKFESIACGSEHSFAIAADSGDLYAWGLNFKGQLGTGDFENRSGPCLVASMYNGGSQQNLLGSQPESLTSSLGQYQPQL